MAGENPEFSFSQELFLFRNAKGFVRKKIRPVVCVFCRPMSHRGIFLLFKVFSLSKMSIWFQHIFFRLSHLKYVVGKKYKCFFLLVKRRGVKVGLSKFSISKNFMALVWVSGQPASR